MGRGWKGGREWHMTCTLDEREGWGGCVEVEGGGVR